MRSVEVREWVRVNKVCQMIWKTGERCTSVPSRSSDSDPVLLTRSTHAVKAIIRIIVETIVTIVLVYPFHTQGYKFSAQTGVGRGGGVRWRRNRGRDG